MDDHLTSLFTLPMEIDTISFIILLVASFLGSLMTAALGVGGGAFVITIMAEIVSPLALIPVHGLVQLGSNSSRAVLAREYTQWHKIVWFLLGALLATFLSVVLIKQMDTSWIPIAVAVFILWLCWGPMPDIGLGTTLTGLFSGGLVTTVASNLVGASGPLVSAWLGSKTSERWTYTANFATCMTLQHGLKLVVFGLAGFAFWEWLSLIIAMIAIGYVGTRFGLSLLGKLPEKIFKTLYRAILTLLALRLLWMNIPVS